MRICPSHFVSQFSPYLQTLLDLGTSPDYKDSRGLTPLYHSAMVGGDPYCCELLLYDHAQLGYSDENGWQEIHQVNHPFLRSECTHYTDGKEEKLRFPARLNISSFIVCYTCSSGWSECVFLYHRLVVMETCSTLSTCYSMERRWAPRMPQETQHYTCVPSTTRYRLTQNTWSFYAIFF